VEGTTAELEAALTRLLQSYSAALMFAGDLPVIGRCRVQVTLRTAIHDVDEDPPPDDAQAHESTRWVARLPARLYVETHVRRQLRHLAGCLNDELLSALPPGDERLTALRDHLEQRGGRLLSWDALRGLLVRLPPVAAALPVVAAALADPFRVDGRDGLTHALGVLAVTAAVVYLVAIWPSVRLGYRVKRAIFSGGVDMAQPLLYKPGKIVWLGVPAPRPVREPTMLDLGVVALTDGVERILRSLFRRVSSLRATPPGSAHGGTHTGATADGGPTGDHGPPPAITRAEDGPAIGPADRLSFPRAVVYRDENAVFAVLGRCKRAETPLDLLLSFSVYVLMVVAAVMTVSWTQYVFGNVVEIGTVLGFGAMTLIVDLVVVQVGLQARRNYRAQLERWEHGPAAAGG
jgi:hypothetical protein